MYQDILKYPFEVFKIDVLEECTKEERIEKEKYYYNLLKPTYNLIEPEKYSVNNPIVRELSKKKCKSKEFLDKIRYIHGTQEFREKCRLGQIYKMKPCIGTSLENNVTIEFDCLQDASKWISENTKYKGKNKTSKIKAVCDGERKSAYGFKWSYK